MLLHVKGIINACVKLYISIPVLAVMVSMALRLDSFGKNIDSF